MKEINSETAYNTALEEVYELMQKGEENISDREGENISAIAKAIQHYEKIYHPFPLPKTLNEIVELKMFKKKLNRTNLAKMLGMAAPKLSQILNNKREPDVSFLKVIHQKLGVDSNFILEKV